MKLKWDFVDEEKSRESISRSNRDDGSFFLLSAFDESTQEFRVLKKEMWQTHDIEIVWEFVVTKQVNIFVWGCHFPFIFLDTHSVRQINQGDRERLQEKKWL